MRPGRSRDDERTAREYSPSVLPSYRVPSRVRARSGLLVLSMFAAKREPEECADDERRRRDGHASSSRHGGLAVTPVLVCLEFPLVSARAES